MLNGTTLRYGTIGCREELRTQGTTCLAYIALAGSNDHPPVARTAIIRTLRHLTATHRCTRTSGFYKLGGRMYSKALRPQTRGDGGSPARQALRLSPLVTHNRILPMVLVFSTRPPVVAPA